MLISSVYQAITSMSQTATSYWLMRPQRGIRREFLLFVAEGYALEIVVVIIIIIGFVVDFEDGTDHVH